ncbi:hypothetical protein K435DRAFT_799182 [Dendrothele bispora CBS 962.96]|uniref:Uncharacterized protein n=1 Tax=Dendrothele bispora (strain CBS 962.96) TaxID=1314807 RepID=A0A4S8LWP9_DENBC|nr:hypothetical protein K435DRAFT_799182 [Dendrothele bispora CBS 962.96]
MTMFKSTWGILEDSSLSAECIPDKPNQGGLLSGLSNIGASKDVPVSSETPLLESTSSSLTMNKSNLKHPGEMKQYIFALVQKISHQQMLETIVLIDAGSFSHDASTIAVIRDGGVSKTALAVQYMMGHFVPHSWPNIYGQQKYTIPLSPINYVWFEVMDTAGQVRISHKTVERMNKQDLPFILLPWHEGANLAWAFQCEFVETLALMAYNIDLIFRPLVQKLRQKTQREAEFSRVTRSKKGGRCSIM